MLIAGALELTTLTLRFAVPTIQGRLYGDPKFPHLIVFHGDVPHSDIVNFQGNFYDSALESAIFWILVVFAIAILAKVTRMLLKRIIANSRNSDAN